MKKIISLGLMLSMALFIAGPAFAQTQGVVNCTVSVRVLGLSLVDGAVNFGTLDLGTTKTTTELGDEQVIQNTGTIALSISLKGNNTTNWTLSPSTGLSGTDKYAQQYSVNGTPNYIDHDLTALAIVTGADIGAGGTSPLNLKLYMPLASSVNTVQTWAVDVIGVE